MSNRLPPDILKKIEDMAAQGFSIGRIKAATGRSYVGIRRHLDPEYRRVQNARCNEIMRSRPAPVREYYKAILNRNELTTPDHAKPTELMLLDAQRRADAPRTTTAFLCGDPPPGYSALDRAKAEGRGFEHQKSTGHQGAGSGSTCDL